MEDEFLQDLEQRAEESAAAPPSQYKQHNGDHDAAGATGFVVKGGPWEQKAPDTASVADFPSFRGSGSQEVSNNVPWGPRR